MSDRKIEVVRVELGAKREDGYAWQVDNKATADAENKCNGKASADYRIEISDTSDLECLENTQCIVTYKCIIPENPTFYKTSKKNLKDALENGIHLSCEEEPALNFDRYHSNWMWGMQESIGSRRLFDVRMPGTHDSGTYTIESIPIVECYAVTQDKGISIGNQLMGGVRYLDLRAGDYNGVSGIRVAHGVVWGGLIKDLLEEIYNFHKFHPYEVLIIDIRNEHGLKMEQKKELRQWFMHYFGDAIMVNPDLSIDGIGKQLHDIQMKDLWKIKKTIVILWDKDISQEAPPTIFLQEQHFLYSQYANSDNPDVVFDKVEEFFRQAQRGCEYFNKLYAAQLIMTPQGSHPSQCVKGMAKSIQGRASNWLKYHQKERLNIVLLDYIFEPLEQAGLVEQIIESNK